VALISIAAVIAGTVLALERPGRARSTLSADRAAAIENRRSGLMTWELGGGRLPVLLLHGYGSSPQDWFQFVETIHLPPGGRFIFPRAPETTTPPEGPAGGRGWWRLRLDSYWRPGTTIPDLSTARPAALARAAREVRVLLGEVGERLRPNGRPAVLGGFSQGAMVAAELAFRSNVKLSALVLLSATPVDEPSWTAVMARRRGLPVFIAHGRNDAILPFAAAERLQAEMRQAGLTVTWLPFTGGHEIPPDVVTALNTFLAAL
jgi:phospholipase/carboxylesterase